MTTRQYGSSQLGQSKGRNGATYIPPPTNLNVLPRALPKQNSLGLVMERMSQGRVKEMHAPGEVSGIAVNPPVAFGPFKHMVPVFATMEELKQVAPQQ